MKHGIIVWILGLNTFESSGESVKPQPAMVLITRRQVELHLDLRAEFAELGPAELYQEGLRSAEQTSSIGDSSRPHSGLLVRAKSP